MLPIATSIIISFCLIWNLLETTHQIVFTTDNIINITDSTQTDVNQQIGQSTDIDSQISAHAKEYKKRQHYNFPTSSEIDDYKDNIIIERIEPKKDNISESQNRENIKPAIILQNKKPKIVIIIDDIANKKQLDKIISINMNLTPSIFPISPHDTAMIEAVNKLDFFMIHLPLEAKKYADELDTIKVNTNIDAIQSTINRIIQTTPKTKYINNHTGSKFTESKSDMEHLLKVLDMNNITFIDSRTTPNSVLNEIAKEQHRLILYRDIFIDNSLDRDSLNKQLEIGVEIAKTRGYAILIAHPHKETLAAIKQAKNNILSDVDIIYLNELDNILKNANISTYSQAINR